MVPVWPAVLWMEMRLGALRVPRRQWPASRGLPRRLEVLLREVERRRLRRLQEPRRLLLRELDPVHGEHSWY